VFFGLSFDNGIFVLASKAVLEIIQFSRYGSSDLASLYRFWIFSHGCREEACLRNICPGCYVFFNGDSYSRHPNDIDEVVRLFFPDILVLALLPMLIDFNSYTRAHSLDIAAQIKNMGELLLVSTCL
jgi:hypothetical protein